MAAKKKTVADKAMSFFKEYWIPIAGCVGAYLLYDKFFGENEEKILLPAYDVESSKVTISEAQAKVYADRLFTAMDGIGTDNDAVTSVYNALKTNPANLVLVYNAFGKRKSTSWWYSGEPEDLVTWLRGDLDNAGFACWNALFLSVGIIT